MNKSTSATISYAGAFHGSLNMAAINQGMYTGTGTITRERHIVTQTRTLSYRFYPHFHPYVRELARRLIESSMRGLQDADTDYLQDSDGSFHSLPNSVRARLPNDLSLKLPKADAPNETEDVKLAGSVVVTIPDGTTIRLTDGNLVPLPGNVVANSAQRGTQVLRADGQKVYLETDNVVALASSPTVRLPENIVIVGADNKPRRLTEPSLVSVPAGTAIQLIGGKPRPTLFKGLFSAAQYGPSALVEQPYPARDLDFSSSGAYAVYNWEVFFHMPLTIAISLSKNQRYEDAQSWFHFIFDPTDDSHGSSPERFWKVKPFQYTDVQLIEDILVNLSTGADPVLQQDTINSIGAWKDAPFRPHLIARYRQTAYMFKTVMAYLDNLIAWGDSLFRQDSGEAINEATQLYVLAANILGTRPQPVPKKGTVRPQNYANLREDLDALGNAMEQLESAIPFDLAPFPISGGAGDQFATLQSIGTSLYFCVPRNDKLLGYWDTVADRLFKIRNSLNFQGIFRQLPLFDPPIDPALLARAAAAGLDISAVVNGANQPLPMVRFQLLAQKAGEICQEVKALGNSLLAAMEKEDNETFSILRARHEKAILSLTETVRYAQLQEAIKSREGLETSFTNATQRYIYYERLLGAQDSDINLPQLDALDTERLAKFKFKAEEPAIARREIAVDIAQDLGASGGKLVSSYEAEELDQLATAHDIQKAVKISKLSAQAISLLPQFGIKFHFWGLGGDTSYGGFNLGKIANFAADVASAIADEHGYDAGRAAKVGAYARREQEWAQQSNLAVGEINQIYKQLRAAQIREAIAEREWHNHQQQIKNAQEIEDFLTNEKNGKTTNQALYAWMKREIRGLYGQVFQFAFDVAKKAERALQHELGKPDASFLQFGYLGGMEGLLAGEKLYFDIKRMELAYHELNQREYELTKHVSLLQVSPTALLQLRRTGRCTVALPEAVFDMDGPGHYFRRIKTVAVTIPCVAGPYTSVNCTLTLLKSAIRSSAALSDGSYARDGAEDARFSDHFSSLQAIVTSTAQNDSGLFETNLRDERYLPFEGAGAISEWQLELPADLRQFDYDTIADVILHMRYTAREGGVALRKGAIDTLNGLIEDAQAAGSVRLFSIRHEFPSAWAKFKNVTIAGDVQTAELTLNLREEHYPFWSRGRLNSVKRSDLFAEMAANSLDCVEHADGTGKKDSLVHDPAFGGLLHGILTNIAFAAPTGPVTLYLTDNVIDDLWLMVTWGT